MGKVYSGSISPAVVIVMMGITKVFVGEIVETGKY
jgi:hypothetical protein